MNREYNFSRFGLFFFISFIAVGHSCAYQNYESDEISRLRYNIRKLTGPVSHGEGPHWDVEKQLLYFVDISGKRIHRYDPCSNELTYAELDDTVGVAIPVAGTSDKFIVGKGKTLGVVTWTGRNLTNPPFKEIQTIESEKEKLGNRFNDGKSDNFGRLWIGTMGFEDPVTGVEPFKGTLYRFNTNPSCHLEPIIPNVTISNGIAWSSNNTYMYYIDTGTKSVRRFNYDITTGEISNSYTLINFTTENISGSPDGMTIDNKGNLWIACWNGSQVINVDSKTGKVINAIKLNVTRPTSVAFGGKNLDILYVTTMNKNLSDAELQQQPDAGALFSISNLGVSGVPSSPVRVPPNCLPRRRRYVL